MRTERPREYCEHCGKDFTYASYAEKIHHSNNCNNHSLGCFVHRYYNECDNDEDRLRHFLDAVGMDYDIDRTNYEQTMDIFYCVVDMLRNGIYIDEKTKPYNDIADYMEKNVDEIKNYFNKMIDDEIDEIERTSKYKIKDLKSRKI